MPKNAEAQPYGNKWLPADFDEANMHLLVAKGSRTLVMFPHRSNQTPPAPG